MPEDPFYFQLPSRQREVDVQDVRLAWRDACADVRLAYLAWQEAAPAPAHTREAFAVYLAAADRETAAALAVAGPGGLTPPGALR